MGFKYSVWTNEGKMEQYQKGLENALKTKPSLIDLLAGPDPRAKELKPGIDAAKAAGIKLQAVEVRRSSDFERAFKAVARERAEVLLVLQNALTTTGRKPIADLAT